MKLIVLYDEPLTGDQRIFPRDTRNYIRSISSEEDKEYTMWHKREIPHILYTMPNRKGFAIVSYKNDEFTRKLFERIKTSIEKNPSISFFNNDIQRKVKEVYIIEYKYPRQSAQFEQRLLKTPMLMSQFARAKSITRDIKIR